MKKTHLFGLLSLLIASLAVSFSTKEINEVKGYFFESSEFEDRFEGDSIGSEWIKSESAKLDVQYSSLQVKPVAYEWGGQIVLGDKRIDESCTITYDFEVVENKKLAPTMDEIRQLRQQAFREEADPLKYDWEEASARYGTTSPQAIQAKNTWLLKKDEIRQRYPYPTN